MTSSISGSFPFLSAATQNSQATSSTMTNASQSSNLPSHLVTGGAFLSLTSSLRDLPPPRVTGEVPPRVTGGLFLLLPRTLENLPPSRRSQLTDSSLRALDLSHTTLPTFTELHVPPAHELPHSLGTLHYVADSIPDETTRKLNEIQVPLLTKNADVTNKRNKNN
jgi:hypothetical protein